MTQKEAWVRPMKRRFVCSAVVTVGAMWGLAACTGAPHPWARAPGAEEVGDWVAVPDGRVRWITRAGGREEYQTAMSLLAKGEAIRLSTGEAPAFATAGPGGAGPPGLEAYLVRGVCAGAPAWCRVWRNSDDGSLWVQAGSWNGETLFGAPPQEAMPVVVFLAERPSTVYATSARGGDGILRGPPESPRAR
jgi:hypothetical protein